jgi:hypothetical protein
MKPTCAAWAPWPRLSGWPAQTESGAQIEGVIAVSFRK